MNDTPSSLYLLWQAFISRVVPGTATDSNPIHVNDCAENK